jgi:hypothetical protein
MNAGKPALGCVVMVFAVGLLWLGACAAWCVGFYRQETAKMQGDADISAHLQSVQGTLVSADGSGKGSTPSRYGLTYRYAIPAGQTLSGSVPLPADRLSEFGMTPYDAKWLFAHPRQWTVEYDDRDPAISRLRGSSYRGGSSPATLWGGEALGLFIGLFGFLFFTAGIFRALWRSRKNGEAIV